MSHAAAVAEPEIEEESGQPEQKKKNKTRRQPPYNVIVWNDDDHSFHYVIGMLAELFGHPQEKGFKLAKQIHEQGKAIVLTTTKEHAELKQDQVHAYGKDKNIAACKGSMTCSIEPSV